MMEQLDLNDAPTHRETERELTAPISFVGGELTRICDLMRVLRCALGRRLLQRSVQELDPGSSADLVVVHYDSLAQRERDALATQLAATAEAPMVLLSGRLSPDDWRRLFGTRADKPRRAERRTPGP